MKNFVLLMILPWWLITARAQEQPQTHKMIPAVEVKTPSGTSFNTEDLFNDGNPMIISFWALWCKPCIQELTSISEVYDEWVDETGVKLIAVSIDDSRSTDKVMPTVDGKNWDYEVLLDPNGDFKRAMNVNLIPHTFVINGKGEIVWEHTSFSEGAELELIDIVRRAKAGQNVSGH